MKYSIVFIFTYFLLIAPAILRGQDCFFDYWSPRYISAPSTEAGTKPSATPTVNVIINSNDSIAKISQYVFGNAVPAWLGNAGTNTGFVNRVALLSPTLIRFPGGSWSDFYFWSAASSSELTDIPDSLYNASNGKMEKFWPQCGMNNSNYPMTVNNYYALRDQIYSEGLITINYSYARYGLSDKPVEQAAHCAAEWVRYDAGWTKYWEIGNENGGPWEPGWQIDTVKNKDDQPMIITGALYGQHFKVFVDSMRAAAQDIGSTIFIGGQILHYNGASSWNVADRKWNEGFFNEVGDSADFYVVHNYFGKTTTTLRQQVDSARSVLNQNISFILQDIANKQASNKPIAMTEWNCEGPDTAKKSITNGLQATVLFCEMMKNKYGMSCRWPLANWEADGLLYNGNNAAIPAWTPRPDFFYIYYLQRYFGDYMLSSSVSGSNDILSYASKFASGHLGIVIVNKGSTEKTVSLEPRLYWFGDQFYIYSLTGTSGIDFEEKVYVNGHGPSIAIGGPVDSLLYIPAWSYSTTGEMKFTSPARSVQFILLEPGPNTDVRGEDQAQIIQEFELHQNYPNPFNPSTTISYSLPEASIVTLKVYDLMGREITTLVQNEEKPAGRYNITFDGSKLSSGIYFYTLLTHKYAKTRPMVLIK